MEIITKDILTVTEGIICHQVNCMGVMGSGIAKAIRDKWPIVYDEYRYFYEKYTEHDWRLLGNSQLVRVDDNIQVANLFAQYNFNKTGLPFTRHTEYGAFKDACKELQNQVDYFGGVIPVYFPYNCGSDRAGGDWNIISKIIEYYFHDAIICKLP